MVCPITQKTCITNGCTTTSCYQRTLDKSKITIPQEKKLYTAKELYQFGEWLYLNDWIITKEGVWMSKTDFAETEEELIDKWKQQNK